jgi:uncharacterized Zn-finger protein
MEFFIMKQYTIALFFLSIIAPQFTHAMENLEFKSSSYDSDFFTPLYEYVLNSEESNFLNNQSSGYTDFFGYEDFLTDIENNDESISTVEKVDPLKQTMSVIQAAINSLEEKEFKCRFCDNTYKNDSILTMHEQTHTVEKPFACSVEGYDKASTSHDTLKDPQLTQQKNFFTCSACPQTFNNHSDLFKHKDTHTREKFFSRSLLAHNNKMADESGIQKENVVSDPHTNQEHFVCSFKDCKETFTTQKALQAHISVHPFICPFKGCNKIFTTQTALNKHWSEHTGQKPFVRPIKESHDRLADTSGLTKHRQGHYPCTIKDCDRLLSSEKSLDRHIRIAHNGEKPLQCQHCNKFFLSECGLEQHVKRIHDGSEDMPYQCSYCPKAYVNSSNLKKHERTQHTGEKPYVCMASGCNEAYASSDRLKSHMEKKHNPDRLNENSSTALQNTSYQAPTNYLLASTTQATDNYLNNNTMQQPYPLYYYTALFMHMQNMQNINR